MVKGIDRQDDEKMMKTYFHTMLNEIMPGWRYELVTEIHTFSNAGPMVYVRFNRNWKYVNYKNWAGYSRWFYVNVEVHEDIKKLISHIVERAKNDIRTGK